MSSSSLSRGQRVLRVDSLSAVLADGYWHEYGFFGRGFFRCRILRCDRSRTQNGLGTLSSPVVGNRLRSAVILAMRCAEYWQSTLLRWHSIVVPACVGSGIRTISHRSLASKWKSNRLRTFKAGIKPSYPLFNSEFNQHVPGMTKPMATRL